MDNRTNTIAGWVLAGFGLALGLSIVTGEVFHAGRPEKMGYPIEGVEEEGGAAAPAEVPIANLLASADPAKGQATFAQCTACHTINQGGANGVGPNLYGVVGDAIASGRGGFAFSDALKAHQGKWDFETLNKWLTSPRKFADGTKMTFAGLSKEQDRANVIAYLNSQGSNLPLPKPENGAPGGASPTGSTGDGSAAKAPDHGDVKGTVAPGAPSQDPNAAKQSKGALKKTV